MTQTICRWDTETHREWLAENGLVLPRRPDCRPWCIQHCQLDESTSFCMGPDIRTPYTPNGYVGIIHEPNGGTRIDLGKGIDDATVEEAEAYARAILTQVARARGEESS